ncbi:2-hydroxycarboxylate transporter family protein [Mycetohabitans rhizoxinica]|uniref:2-hydroxycarboxylate transporter family protein n=1 Tax=Mycetohabitans rhizoxinica TaxID=412963 RepID=A0ABZ2Q3G0_9BURK
MAKIIVKQFKTCRLFSTVFVSRLCAWRASPHWPQWMHRRIGIIPVPVYGLLLACIAALVALKCVSSDLPVMIAVLAVAGFTCAELGAKLPGLRHIGGPVIVALLLPSWLAHHHLLPAGLISPIHHFWQTTNIIYLFSALVIVGSLLGMNRALLTKGISRFAIPVMAGSVAAAVIGTITGMVFGLDASDAFFYIVVPIMAGGIGEGALPLTLGYAALLQLPQDQLFARVVPAVVLGNLSAIMCAAAFEQISRRCRRHSNDLTSSAQAHSIISREPVTVEQVAAAGIMAISLYLAGLVLQHFTHLPAILGMLVLAVVVKLSGAVPAQLEYGAHWVYCFFARAVTYPLMFGIGITLMPWEALLAALTLAHFVTTLVTVLTLMITGFFVGHWIKLSATESAMINACHSGMGSTGDLAILTAANRLPLMPFAQLATRMGGAMTVILALGLMEQCE